MADGGRTGRLTKLTPDIQAKVIQAISGGNTRDTAAAYAGVDRATLFRWLAKGREANAGVYRDLCDAIEKAEADAVAVSVGLIRRAAQTQWQAAAWWLERRYADAWGRKDRVDGTVKVDDARSKLAEIRSLRPQGTEDFNAAVARFNARN